MAMAPNQHDSHTPGSSGRNSDRRRSFIQDWLLLQATVLYVISASSTNSHHPQTRYCSKGSRLLLSFSVYMLIPLPLVRLEPNGRLINR
jgi:hypothetical protein